MINHWGVPAFSLRQASGRVLGVELARVLLYGSVVLPKFHPLAKKAKNIEDAAVLIATIGAVIIGSLVFLPYLI